MTNVFEEKPESFVSQLTIVGCYCQFKERFLLLHRHVEEFDGDTWCLPAGRLEEGEKIIAGAVRELKEETGIEVGKKDLKHLGDLFIEASGFRYTFVIYQKRFLEEPEVSLDLTEHVAFRWVTLDEALALPLVQAGKEVLQFCQKKLGSDIG